MDSFLIAPSRLFLTDFTDAHRLISTYQGQSLPAPRGAGQLKRKSPEKKRGFFD